MMETSRVRLMRIQARVVAGSSGRTKVNESKQKKGMKTMLNLTKSGRGRLAVSALVVSILCVAPMASAVQLVCAVNVDKVTHGPRDGVVGVRAEILDGAGNVTATRNWKLCRTEISDNLRATLPLDVSDWTSEQDCQNVLDLVNVAKALDRPIQIVFREAPDNTDPTLEAVTCEDVKSQDPILFMHLHQISWGD